MEGHARLFPSCEALRRAPNRNFGVFAW